MPLGSFDFYHPLHDMGLSLKSSFYLQRDLLGMKSFSFERHYQQEIVSGLGVGGAVTTSLTIVPHLTHTYEESIHVATVSVSSKECHQCLPYKHV